ncbi:META domain-containing protein [Gordonia insulae]|uniref:DUF306 domain-containing protein n=1 Tax=Gordonia insulae TaxID=2420509 RepID=A0A3G8JJ86_9ACTN|nr:META domain-containing protein [Gordonia insulae]AZG44675.1 hypothetical protein D7316_01261 [Gordonia insulae]
MSFTGGEATTNRIDHPIPAHRVGRRIGTASRRDRTRLTVTVVGLLALIAAILGATPATAVPAPRPPAPIRPLPVPPPGDPLTPLTGKTYASVAVVGGAIPGGGPMTISFASDHRVGLGAGCNRHLGTVTVAGDQLRVRAPISTMMACPPPRSGADSWLTTFTSVPLTWRAVGPVLTLSSPRQTVVLVERPARPR